jgi:hypothetical protein
VITDNKLWSFINPLQLCNLHSRGFCTSLTLWFQVVRLIVLIGPLTMIKVSDSIRWSSRLSNCPLIVISRPIRQGRRLGVQVVALLGFKSKQMGQPSPLGLLIQQTLQHWSTNRTRTTAPSRSALRYRRWPCDVALCRRCPYDVTLCRSAPWPQSESWRQLLPDGNLDVSFFFLSWCPTPISAAAEHLVILVVVLIATNQLVGFLLS